MTEISALASLLLLNWTNNAVDTDDYDFFLRNGKQEIFDCFDAVTVDDINKFWQNDFHGEMDHTHENEFEWPSKKQLGNSYKYFREQYITNLKTNLNTHCEKILTHFLRIRCYEENRVNQHMEYDNTDIRNALKDVLKNSDWVNGDIARQQKKDVLLQHLVDIGFPANVNIKYYVKVNWFQALWPFIRMQRVVETFLMNRANEIEQWNLFIQDPVNNQQPNGTRPPFVRNFTVIPNCNFHLKHIKIDSSVCYELASKYDLIRCYVNPKTGRVNQVKLHHYTDRKLPNDEKVARQSELFDTLFDMNKIRRNGKRAKMFYGQIVTDGVSASVIYERNHPLKLFCKLDQIVP